ncbi:hypothetical protein [Saccharicrinis sp. 156]|uniref:hypothetical protein n=1 Tax=Saccharicrinis sp. 156 TaxID=3417574 RepID=UPI003D33EFD5
MSKNSYDAILPEAQVVTDERLKKPYMPIGIYLQEAEDLYVWASKDKDDLIQAGLTERIFEKLQSATDACRYAQSLWMTELQARKDAEERWANEARLAFDLRDRLLHTFRYAYRKNENALQVVADIAEDAGNADMIQDLSDEAALARKYPDELTAIHFDASLIETADTLSGEMADLRALANGEKRESNETLTIRNQMYTLLKEMVDEIRDCGKYLFWRDEKRIQGYISKYNRDKKH